MSTKNARKDPAWKYGEEHQVPAEGTKKGYKYIKCSFCSKVVRGGVKRMKDHLGCTHKDVIPCPSVPDDVKEEMLQYLKQFQDTKVASQRILEENVTSGAYYNGGGNVNPSGNSRGVRGPMDRFLPTGNEEGPSEKMTPASAKEHRNQVCLDIGRCFYENGIPFNVARSPSFISMLRSVGNYGRGLKPPSMHELRTWILDEEVKTTTTMVDDIKATWKTTGVSLLSDGWSDTRNRSLINFLINNQYGTVFLKTVDASDCIKSAQKIFELLDEVVEEVGEDIVLQVVTDNVANYKAAGQLLMGKRKGLYWTTMPLVEVLRLVDGEQTPAMGFLYGAMDECKEKIAKNMNNKVASYKEIWSIIDQKWDFQMHRDLHAAAYYLNPRYRWSPDVSEHPEIKRGLFNVMARFTTDTNVYLKIDEQLTPYGEKKGLFGFRGALATYKTRPPVTWWAEYGDDTPELKAFAIKVLGLTCSASACERNWSTFNQVHTKRRNRLNTKRMNNLVYIMYNKKLKQKFVKKKNLSQDEDPLVVEDVSSDDEWIAEPDDNAIDCSGEGSSKAGVEGSGEATREEGESSSVKKRKAVQMSLIDEDGDEDEVNLVEDDDDSADDETVLLFEHDLFLCFLELL